MLRVILDTNIILASISTHSPYRIIIEKLLEESFILIVTSDILLEYEEKIQDKFSLDTATNFIDALLLLPNVDRVNVLFNSKLIIDEDDNKFLDAYYSGKANYLVTNDKHFEILNKIKTPHHNLVKIDEFVNLISQ